MSGGSSGGHHGGGGGGGGLIVPGARVTGGGGYGGAGGEVGGSGSSSEKAGGGGGWGKRGGNAANSGGAGGFAILSTYTVGAPTINDLGGGVYGEVIDLGGIDLSKFWIPDINVSGSTVTGFKIARSSATGEVKILWGDETEDIVAQNTNLQTFNHTYS